MPDGEAGDNNMITRLSIEADTTSEFKLNYRMNSNNTFFEFHTKPGPCRYYAINYTGIALEQTMGYISFTLSATESGWLWLVGTKGKIDFLERNNIYLFTHQSREADNGRFKT